MMYPSKTWQRVALGVGLGIAIVAMLLALYPANNSLAQGDSTTINVGDVVEGQLGEDGTATYTFTAEAGDVVQISVFAFDFVPTIEVRAAGTPVAIHEQFPVGRKAAQLTYLITSSGEHNIEIRGQNDSSGRFALSLTAVVSDLPEGMELSSGQIEVAELAADTPAIFHFSGDETSSLELSVRSRTDDFHPHIFLMTASGEFIAEATSSYLTRVDFTVESGIRDYTVIVTKGTFADTASVEIELSGGGVGLTEIPDDTCYVTASTRINIRAGGSTEHPIVSVMGAERFLKVIATDPANDIWYQVQIPDGRSGWVFSDVVALIGNCDGLPEIESPPLPTVEDESTTEATVEPTMEATMEPTVEATVEPPDESTMEPTVEGTMEPTSEPTMEPTVESTVEPTGEPTSTAS